MVLTHRRAWRLLMIAVVLAGQAPAQQPCAGVTRANFGYGFLSCPECFRGVRVGGEQYTGFSKEPVLHDVRPNGPAVGKLFDNDTLMRIDGLDIRTDSGAIRLATSLGPTRLTVRHGAPPRTVVIQPDAVCWSQLPWASTAQAVAALTSMEQRLQKVDTLRADKERLDTLLVRLMARLRAPSLDSAIRAWQVGGVSVDVHGPGVAWAARDPVTGALTVRVGADTIVIRPPQAP